MRPALLALLLASAAMAQEPRLAMHPLELREMTPAQQEIVQAQFEVLLARVPGVRLAGSAAVEEALAKPQGHGCELRDACMRFLAQETESLYAAHVRVRPGPREEQLLLEARVVRADGAVVRKVMVQSALQGRERAEAARTLLARGLEALALGALSPTLSVELPAQVLKPEVAVDRAVAARRPVGFATLGVGGAMLVAGTVVAVLASVGRGALTVDATGAVPPAQAMQAREVAREGQAATVLIPLGAVVTLAGVALGFWPSQEPTAAAEASRAPSGLLAWSAP
jgi:hypothetical protein